MTAYLNGNIKIYTQKANFLFIRPAFILLLLILLSNEVQSQSKKQRFYLVEDRNKDLTPGEVLQQYRKGIEPVNNKNFNVGFTHSIYWLIVPFTREIADSILLTIGDHHINKIQFYYANHSDPVLMYITGDYLPFKQRPVDATGFYFPLSKDGIYLARIDKSNESLQLNFDIDSYSITIKIESDKNMIYFFFTGMILLLIVFGLFLFFISGDFLYILYMLYIGSGWLWVLSNSGLGFQYLWPHLPWFASKARPVFSFLIVASAILFMIRYLGGVWSKKLLWFLYSFSASLWIGIGIILLFNEEGYQTNWWLYIQYSIPLMVLFYISFIIVILINRSVKGDRLALFYLAGISILLVFTIMQVGFYTGNINDQPFLQKFGNSVGYIAESIIITAGLVYRFNRYKVEKENLLVEMNQKEQENIKALIGVQESERNNIATQLHDVAGSLLSAAKLNLSSMREKEHKPDELQFKLEKTEEAVTLVSETVRSLSHALSPVMLKKVGFKNSLENVVSIFNASGKINVSLVVVGFEHFDNRYFDYYTILYSMIYELLNNIIKHAHSTKALVQIIEHDDSFLLTVEDDGIGINENVLSSKTHGLSNIKSKVQYFKGLIEIENNYPKGTIITISIPRTS